MPHWPCVTSRGGFPLIASCPNMFQCLENCRPNIGQQPITKTMQSEGKEIYRVSPHDFYWMVLLEMSALWVRKRLLWNIPKYKIYQKNVKIYPGYTKNQDMQNTKRLWGCPVWPGPEVPDLDTFGYIIGTLVIYFWYVLLYYILQSGFFRKMMGRIPNYSGTAI